jgi:hypothetical protein
MQIKPHVKRQIDHLCRDRIYNPICTQFDTDETYNQMNSDQALWGEILRQLERDLGELFNV